MMPSLFEALALLALAAGMVCASMASWKRWRRLTRRQAVLSGMNWRYDETEHSRDLHWLRAQRYIQRSLK